MTDIATCRFCKKWGPADETVKYSRRHYAHFACYIDGGKSLDALPMWQVEKFPYFLLKERGLLEYVNVRKAAELIGAGP